MQKIKRAFIKLGRFIKFLTANFKGVLLFMFLLYILMPTSKEAIISPNLVRIDLVGQILDPQEVLQKIDDARKDKNIKGVLFVINSGGGAVAPSIELSYAIKRLAETKPVVAYAAGTMASGSYYAAIWANKIFANPGSLIGSIGVIMQGYNIEKLLGTLGIKPQIAKAGTYKESGTMDREWTKAERAELEKVIHNTYEMFVTDVANARHLKRQNHTQFADAHIFTAKGAMEVGLIDTVGTVYEASRTLQTLSGVKEPIWQEPTAMESFFEQLSNSTAAFMELYFPAMRLK